MPTDKSGRVRSWDEFTGEPAAGSEGREFARGLTPYTEHEINNLSNNNKISIATSDAQVREFVEQSINANRQGEKLLIGRIGNEAAQRILDHTGLNLDGYNLEFRADEIKHTYNEHSNPKREASRGQIAITADDIAMFPRIISDFDDVIVARDNSLHFIKNVDGYLTAVSVHANRSKSLSLKTMYKNNSGDAFQPINAPRPQSPTKNVQNELGATTTANTNNITSGRAKINTQPENILPPPRERTINNIPETDHTPEFMRNRLARNLADSVHERLKASGHEGWQNDYNVIVGGKRFGVDGRADWITPKGLRVLDGIVHRIGEAGNEPVADTTARDMYQRAGLRFPEAHDDIRDIISQNYMTKGAFKKFASEYNRAYWDEQAAARVRPRGLL